MPYKDAEKRRAYQASWYIAHRDEHKARGAAWRAAHPQRVRAIRRRYRNTLAHFISDVKRTAKKRLG